MKTLANDLNNIAILSEVEMSKIFGGEYYTNSYTTEDEDVWM